MISSDEPLITPATGSAGSKARTKQNMAKLAESVASDSTIMALAGHPSRACWNGYSHIRMNAKRQAVEALSLKPKSEGHPRTVTVKKVS